MSARRTQGRSQLHWQWFPHRHELTACRPGAKGRFGFHDLRLLDQSVLYHVARKEGSAVVYGNCVFAASRWEESGVGVQGAVEMIGDAVVAIGVRTSEGQRARCGVGFGAG
jgi:hypothetical protein